MCRRSDPIDSHSVALLQGHSSKGNGYGYLRNNCARSPVVICAGAAGYKCRSEFGVCGFFLREYIFFSHAPTIVLSRDRLTLGSCDCGCCEKICALRKYQAAKNSQLFRVLYSSECNLSFRD